MSMAQINVGRRKVQVYEAGNGDPILYLHGVADMHGAAEGPFAFHQALAASGKVIAPAHPGCVGTDEDDTLETIDDLVFHTLEVMDALDLDRPTVIGNSIGGWLAAEIAARNPERVGKLVLIGATGVFVENEPIGDLFMAVQPRNGGIADLRSMLFAEGESQLAQELFPDWPDEKAQGMRRYQVFRFSSRIGFKPPYFYHAKLRHRLHRFLGPTLILWGSEDRFVPSAHAAAYGASLSGSRIEVIDGAGHAVILEQASIVAQKISDFLIS